MKKNVLSWFGHVTKEWQKKIYDGKWCGNSLSLRKRDLRKHSIKDTEGRLHKKHENSPEVMYGEVCRDRSVWPPQSL